MSYECSQHTELKNRLDCIDGFDIGRVCRGRSSGRATQLTMLGCKLEKVQAELSSWVIWHLVWRVGEKKKTIRTQQFSTAKTDNLQASIEALDSEFILAHLHETDGSSETHNESHGRRQRRKMGHQPGW